VSRALLDTHALVWWLEGRERLSAAARNILEDGSTSIFVSAASAWELAIKTELGKFRSPELVRNLDRAIQEEGFRELAISIEHASQAGSLRGRHKDPFDRMLIAQARIENLPIVSTDKLFDSYAVQRIW
jgi:PIN domain nuclease of toxin-antitoxin system